MPQTFLNIGPIPVIFIGEQCLRLGIDQLIQLEEQMFSNSVSESTKLGVSESESSAESELIKIYHLIKLYLP
jgi:hypothetical protein